MTSDKRTKDDASATKPASFAGGSSSTARLIARALIFHAQDASTRSLVPPDAVEMCGWFLEEGNGGATPQARRRALKRWEHLAGAPWFRRLAGATERATLPGILTHFALRKRYLEEAVRQSLSQDGFEQVVVLGAGFDTLAPRFHRAFPHKRFIEADHPGTQRVKVEALARHGAVGPNLHFVDVDLADDDLAARLHHLAAASPPKNTVWIAEGLLMYLPPSAVDRLFRFSLRDAVTTGTTSSAPRHCFAFTFLEPRGPEGATDFARSSGPINHWLRLRGEKFQWGIERDDLPAWLEARGWRARAPIADASALRERYLIPKEDAAQNASGKKRAVPQGDLVCVADALA